MKRQLIVVGLLAGLLGGSMAACDDGDRDGTAAGTGVTKRPCPNAVDRAKGCVYLGLISDLTVGPRAAEATAVTEAQRRFWERVNRDGGIGGYEIDAETYVRDNRDDVETHTRVYREIRGKVLALGQTMGSGTTAAIMAELRADGVVAAPASWTSGWAFEPGVVESGASYCVEAVNAVDHVRSSTTVRSVMSVHLPGDYGDDGAAGVKAAAEANGITFINIKTDPGADKQSGAVGAILARRPDLVVLTTDPAETAVIVQGAAAGGFTGRIIGSGPSWDPSLLDGAAAPALAALYQQAAPWGPWSADTPGHRAMRVALGAAPPHQGHVSGWIWSYPLKAALTAAVKSGELTRASLVAAVRGLGSVDYEGMLPAGAGNFAGGRAGGVTQSMILSPATGTGVTDVPVVRDFFAGPSVGRVSLDRPCFQQL